MFFSTCSLRLQVRLQVLLVRLWTLCRRVVQTLGKSTHGFSLLFKENITIPVHHVSIRIAWFVLSCTMLFHLTFHWTNGTNLQGPTEFHNPCVKPVFFWGKETFWKEHLACRCGLYIWHMCQCQCIVPWKIWFSYLQLTIFEPLPDEKPALNACLVMGQRYTATVLTWCIDSVGNGIWQKAMQIRSNQINCAFWWISSVETRAHVRTVLELFLHNLCKALLSLAWMSEVMFTWQWNVTLIWYFYPHATQVEFFHDPVNGACDLGRFQSRPWIRYVSDICVPSEWSCRIWCGFYVTLKWHDVCLAMTWLLT